MMINGSIVNALPALPVVLPLVAAALLAALRKQLSRAVSDGIALACALLHTGACLTLLLLAEDRTIIYWFGNWYPRGTMVLGITFVIDPVSASLALLCSTLALLALLFSWRYIDAGSGHLQPLVLVFLAGMSGFCLTGDLFNLFVFFELMSTAAFALTGLKTGEPAPLQGAFNFAVTNTIAAFLVLTGIAFLYAITGALNIAQIGLALQHRHDPVVLFACALITSGFLTKAATVPFHFWLPDAHAVSPTPVCVLFSGVMVELGLYAILRLNAVIFLPALDARGRILGNILLGFAAFSAIYGGIMCYAEHHLKRLLAYSTVSHAGLMLMAIATLGPVSTAGFVIYVWGHGLVKASLFFVAGLLLHHYRSASEPVLHVRVHGRRMMATLWFMGGLGLAGFAGFSTCLGEALASSSAESQGHGWVTWIFFVSGILTAGAVFRVGLHTFIGWGDAVISDRAAQVDEAPETGNAAAATPWFLQAAPLLCLAGALLLPWFPNLHARAFSAADRLTSAAIYLHSVYLGPVAPAPLAHFHQEWGSSALRGVAASILALLLALSSVFRNRLRRVLRIGPFLEGPLLGLRTLQSGQVGDYVVWLTVGVVSVGMAYMLLLR